MDELTVIGAENGALVVVSADGSRFRVPITEALHTALRQNRPAATALHRVGPREVQALIRQGLTATEVATQTGEPLEYIQRFEGPVLAEREYVVTAARSVPVAVAADTDSGATGTFGSAIDHRLTHIGARDARWESRKQESHWIVSVSFLDGDIARTAVWSFDPKKSLLAPANHEAQSLSQQQEDGPVPLMPRLRAVPTDAAPAGRFDSGAFALATDVARPSPAIARPERPIARIAELDTTDTQELGNTADLLEALRRRRGERESAPVDDWDSSRAAHPSTGSIRIVDVPIDPSMLDDGALDARQVDARQVDAHQVDARQLNAHDVDHEDIDDRAIDDAALTGLDAAPAAQERTKPAARRGRAAMPSWDEIVFGARPDDDSA